MTDPSLPRSDFDPGALICILVKDFRENFLSENSFHVIDAGVIPKECFFTKGVGVHKENLAFFELALRSAGLAYCNLVLVSSVYPPYCRRISKEEGVKLLRPGEIVFCVYDREGTNEPNRLVADRYGLPAALYTIAIFPLLAAIICFLVVKPAAQPAK